jgi:hypothetical protein
VMARDNYMLVRVVMFSMLFHMPPILDLYMERTIRYVTPWSFF